MTKVPSSNNDEVQCSWLSKQIPLHTPHFEIKSRLRSVFNQTPARAITMWWQMDALSCKDKSITRKNAQ